MKTMFYILLAVEFGIALFLANTTCVLRTDFVRALRAVHEHPTSETAIAEYKHQQFLERLSPFIYGGSIFGMLALPTLGFAALDRYISAHRSSRRRLRATPPA